MDAGDRDDIAAALKRLPAVDVARRLIVPLADVLEVQQQMRRATAPPRRDLTVATVHYTTPKPVFADPPSEPFAMTTPPPSPVSDVFARAEQIDDERVAAAFRAAVQARELLVELVDGYDAQAGVRARIAELEEQLAAERAKIGGTGDPVAVAVTVTPAATVTSLVSAKEIRAWADSAGVFVPPKGPIPRDVREKFVAAQQATA